MRANEGQAEFEFFDFPRDLSLSNYELAQKRYLDQICGYPEVVSVYRMGGFTAPGISDLDLLVVLDAKINCDPSVFSVGSINRMPETRGVFRHGPMLMDTQVFVSLPLVFYASGLTHLYGHEIPQTSLPVVLEQVRDVVLAIEFLPRLIHRLKRMLLLRRLGIREGLASLYSATHFQKLSDDVCACLPSNFPELTHQIVDLRSNWESGYSDLPHLFEQMIVTLYDFSWNLAERFLDLWLDYQLPNYTMMRQGSWQWACFGSKRHSRDRAEGRVFSISSFNYAETVIHLPVSILGHFLFLSSLFPVYDLKIRTRTHPRLSNKTAQVQSSDSDYDQYMQEFSAIAARQFDFIIKNRLSAGRIMDLGIFDWDNTFLKRPGYRPKIDWVVNLIYRIFAKQTAHMYRMKTTEANSEG